MFSKTVTKTGTILYLSFALSSLGTQAKIDKEKSIKDKTRQQFYGKNRGIKSIGSENLDKG